jgi:hypothetical protein
MCGCTPTIGRYFFFLPQNQQQVLVEYVCNNPDPSATCFCQESGICCNLTAPLPLDMKVELVGICDESGEY